MFTKRPLASYLRDGKFVSQVVIGALIVLLFWNLVALLPGQTPPETDADVALKKCLFLFFFPSFLTS